MPVAIVKVDQSDFVVDLHPNDAEITGEYPVTLAGDVTPEQVADVALDVFHSEVPVKVLEDFTFTVLFNGVEVEGALGHDSGSYLSLIHI